MKDERKTKAQLISELEELRTRVTEMEARSVRDLRDGVRVIGLQGALVDTAESRRLEEDLRHSEERYRSFVEHFQGIVFHGDRDFRPQFFHGAVEEITGYTEEDFTSGRVTWADLIHPEDRHAVLEDVERFHAGTDRVREREYRIRAKPDRVRWVRENIQKMGGESSGVSVLGIVHDITASKLVERELLRANERLGHILGTSPAIVYSCDVDMTKPPEDRHIPTFVSARIIDTLGYRIQECLGNPGWWAAHLHPDDAPSAIEDMGTLFAEGRLVHEYRFQAKDGSWRWIRDEAVLVRDAEGNPVEFIGSWVDITDRKEAEEALREGEERYRQVFTTVPDAVMLFDAETRQFLDVNDSCEKLYDYTRREMLDMQITDITAEPEETEKSLTRTLDGDLSRIPFRFHRRRDGTVFPVEISASVFELQGRRVLCGVVRDITERIRSEESRKEGDRRFASVFDSMPVGMVLAGWDGTLVLYNDAFLTQSGYTPDELARVGNLSRLVSDRSGGRGLLARLQDARRLDPTEVELHHEDGRGGAWLLTVEPIMIRREPCWQVMLQDISDRVKTEQEMVRLERLRALGEMAAGISHNLNNILVTILGPAQLLKRKLEQPELLREVQDIVASGERARDLVHRLNEAVRGEEDDRLYPVLLNKVVEQAVDEARPRWRDEPEARGIAISVLTDLGDVPAICGTESGVHDILINLLFNAVDAMPEGGEIRVRTRTVRDGVELAVADTGVGMDEETRRRLFEPFFTSKAEVGTGLGLATVHGTVVRWGGEVDVESRPGQGAAFTVWFPAWHSGVEPVTAEPGQREEARRGSVLIVDDDAGVVEWLARALSDRHDVSTATSAERALEGFGAGDFDVVLIDLGLPSMPGDRLAELVRKADSAVSTVLITGWELPEDDPRVLGFEFRLQKPLDVDEVLGVVARAIALRDSRGS